ncbi:MAG: ATP-binding protein [Chitinivibrionia bacterium]|nr:ATP-binding protein [Chitinivibrionia bacterium]
MFEREEKKKIAEYLSYFPVVAILGPRQCGKTTLAKIIAKESGDSIYLDMEKESDYLKLSDPELFFNNNLGKLIIIDEIQIRENLFGEIRSFVDSAQTKTPILILGSASPRLIKQSSQTLAGRIAFCELSPLNCVEMSNIPIQDIWLKGGFPGSITAPNINLSNDWRTFYIKTFIERDLPQLGINLASMQINRLFSLISHSHAEILNFSKLGEIFGVSHTAFRGYIDFLEGAFLIRTLQPFSANTKKRLVKTPKVYLRDSGLFHSLQKINSFNDLLGHTMIGNSWEGFAIEQICSVLSDWNPCFYRTSAGAEIDLLLEKSGKIIAIELKSSTSPKVSKGFWSSIEDLSPTRSFVICPIEDIYPYKDNVFISGIRQFLAEIKK